MSNNLWVGNLAADVLDSELRNLFEKHGVVDSVTCYPSRNYAFVYLKNAEDAKRAKDSLQGVVLHGRPLRIDFAKPAKPCKCLWVSGISTSVSKEDLEGEFSKFGKIEEFKFQRDKNAALIDYFRLEDASKALKAMHGKKKGGTTIRVDYLRSHSRKDQGSDFHELMEGQHHSSMGHLVSPWLLQDPFRHDFDPFYYGPRIPQHILASEGRYRNKEQPSNILCISYPPAVHIDELMLHNAMILFGEIEEIRSFPLRHCSFVEFRSMEEAERAMEGLQGKLFNDPRISITFATDELTPTQYLTGFPPEGRGPRPDIIGQPNSFHGHGTPLGGGHGSLIRPFAPPASFVEPILPGPEFSFSGPNSINQIDWRSSPSKPTFGTRDIFDASQIQRDPKRLRTDGSIPLKEMNDQVLLTDQIYRGAPRVKSVVPSRTDCADVDYIWRGIIAKGGTPVCCARCVPVGDWIGYEIPDTVNCSARTGLDMLAKHYVDAVGFDIVFFLPDSEEDFASYTEFLRYMGDRNRAGVVKFDDGTTLFLVPPSDFLRKVLKVSGPERLYGIVLKFQQHPSDSPSGPPLSQPQKEYGVSYDHSDILISNPQPVYSVQPTSTTQAGLSLTPELVATLASLAKVNPSGQQTSVAGPPLTSDIQKYEHETSDLTGQFMKQQAQGHLLNTADGSNLAVTGNDNIQDPSFNVSYSEVAASVTSTRSQTPQFASPLQATQQYQLDYPQNLHTVDGVTSLSNQVCGTNVYAAQSMVPGGVENQQHQSALNGAIQQDVEFDADKNERYQSTLQFAASLLRQIQQKRSATGVGEMDGNR